MTAEAGSDPCRFLAGADVLVVDPPRKGLGASLLAALTTTPSQPTAAPQPNAPPPQLDSAAGGNAANTSAQPRTTHTPSEQQHTHEAEQGHDGRLGDEQAAYEQGPEGNAQDGAPSLTSLPSRLVYLSCGFRALQHDLRALLGGGWSLRSATAFLFFPGTDALETLVLLTRGEEGSEAEGMGL